MGVRRQTNLASRRRRPVRLVATLLWAAVAAVIAILAVVVIETGRIEDDLAQVTDHALRLNEQIGGLREEAESAPDIEALRDQSRRVLFFNDLTGERHLPITAVLGLLEEKLPRDVWVSQLSYSAETGRLSLSVQTDDETALPPALRTLEAEDRLGSVILDRQLRLQQGGRQLVQYDIQAVAR